MLLHSELRETRSIFTATARPLYLHIYILLLCKYNARNSLLWYTIPPGEMEILVEYQNHYFLKLVGLPSPSALMFLSVHNKYDINMVWALSCWVLRTHSKGGNDVRCLFTFAWSLCHYLAIVHHGYKGDWMMFWMEKLSSSWCCLRFFFVEQPSS